MTGRAADRVDRLLVETRPNQLWVLDVTDGAARSGFVYGALVTDMFARPIVGWGVSASMRTDFVPEALEQALYARRGECSPG